MPQPPEAQSTDDSSWHRTAALRALGAQYPNRQRALAAVARLQGELALPKDTVHVISDVHGDDEKLRHVINNASGTLRPLVERMFAPRLSPRDLRELLTLLFYPREFLSWQSQFVAPDERRDYAERLLGHVFDLLQEVARRHTRSRVAAVFPPEYAELIAELLHDRSQGRGGAYWNAAIDALAAHGDAFAFLRLVVRAVRNLTIDELVIAGDCWDRGPRGDRVVGNLQRQPNVRFVWGNHDVSWLGACLGHEALVANVLRISIRYRQLSQLEEGYGITLQPLEHLVREAYEDDPAEHFMPRGHGLREAVTMARMQKAVAVLQFKLEGQTIARNPQFDLDHRRLLHRIDWTAGTVEIDGLHRRLTETHFPTIDRRRPYELTAEESACIERTCQSFMTSRLLREQCQFLVGCGAMYLRRDDHLIFHGCVPVDERGEWLEMPVDGRAYRGRALFEAIDVVFARSMDRPAQADRDLLWYLWCGPRSPLFGKDRITTFENDLVDDAASHVETKNPYFQLIHEVGFCEQVLREFGADPQRGLIVNGHVPVRVEAGESPVKRSGKAITIDGAFSEAYGDHGFTLVLEPERTILARHDHFESVEAAVRDGIDIIPTISVIRESPAARTLADTERGQEIRQDAVLLEQLIEAYRTNQLRPRE